MRRRLSFAAAAGACLLAACAPTAAPVPPAPVPPAAYSPVATPGTLAVADDWWRDFKDDGLNRLVAEALAGNADLAVAAARARQARLGAGLAAEALEPRIGATVGASRTWTGDDARDAYTANLSVSWEVDLWNRLGAERDAAAWAALASDQDRAAVAHALAAGLVEAYWRLALVNQQLRTGLDSLADARRTLEIARAGRRAGAASQLDLRQAEQNVLAQEAAQNRLALARIEVRATLALLLGQPAWTEAGEPQSLAAVALEPLAPGLPAELLARRPDLRSAEFRLRATVADVDAARARFYPTLTLSAAGSGSSGSLGRLLADPVLALGGGLALPFLDRDRLEIDLRVSEAEFDIARTVFRQALLRAFVEVETALASGAELAAEAERRAAVLDAAREVERLSALRYRAGAIPLRDWLEAQERRRSAELALAQVRFEAIRNRVDLYLALGGGPR